MLLVLGIWEDNDESFREFLGLTNQAVRVGRPVALNFRSSGVWVLESLGHGDVNTGLELYDAVLAPRLGSAARYIDAQSYEQFMAALNDLANEAEESGLKPIVHIETHGAQYGLRLGSGELVFWDDFVTSLTRAKVAARNNLLAVVAACEGINLARVFGADTLGFLESGEVEWRAPVRAVLGPELSVTADAISRGFRAFYEIMLDRRDAGAAVEALQGFVPELRLLAAERLFAAAFEESARNLPPGARQAAFARLKRTYLMLDLDPSLEETFAEVILS